MRRWREAIVVPLRGDAGIVGTLSVADRMGDVRSFDNGDMRLLETVASHARVALQNSRLIDQLRHESLHDALTGLPNRVLLRNDTVDELLAIGREQSRGCAVMIMDLDGFKEVNDTLGHQHGDELLKAVASRTVDAAGPRVTVARLGGDEFALMLPDCPDAAEARDIAARVLAALDQPTSWTGSRCRSAPPSAWRSHRCTPRMSTGPAPVRRRRDVRGEERRRRSQGLRVRQRHLEPRPLGSHHRAARRSGHGRSGSTSSRRRASPEDDRASRCSSGGTTQARVLFPDEFIPLAERSGLIHLLTAHVLGLALRRRADWRDLGIEVSIAVNLSPRSLHDPGLCAR